MFQNNQIVLIPLMISQEDVFAMRTGNVFPEFTSNLYGRSRRMPVNMVLNSKLVENGIKIIFTFRLHS